MRRTWACFFCVLTGLWTGCGSSDPEPPKGAVPEIAPGRVMPEAEGGKSGAGNPMPAPPG